MVQNICSSCGTTFDVVAVIARICKECPECVEAGERLAVNAWRAGRAAEIATTVVEKVTACGFSASECAAELADVPAAIKRALPRAEVAELLSGNPLSATFAGFGVSGGQGIGKTMCIAAIMRARTMAILLAAIEKTDRVPDGTEDIAWHDVAFFRWVNWPEAAAWMKTTSMEDHGAKIIATTVAKWIHAPILVLDDIGRERISRGGYDEDLAVSALDRVIDARSRAHAPMVWTSNLTRAAIATRYGAALTSRLLGAAPAIEIGKMPDRRLQPTG